MLRHVLAVLCTAAPVFATKMKYELFEYESQANTASVVTHGKARFTVLTDSLVRMEYSSGSTFEDRPSIAFVNRAVPTPEFQHNVVGNALTITTSRFNLTYTPGSSGFSSGLLQVAPVGDSTFQTWRHGQTSATDSGNLRGTFRTLDGKAVTPIDCSNDKLDHCEWGLVSRTGWALVDDTGVPVMDDDDWWTDDSGKMLKNSNDEDLYLFAHSHRYTDALKDYTQVGGRIPIFPRNNHGVWFTRWLYYTNNDVMHVIEEYKRNGLPLDVMILDMNWHKKDDWSGYSWDTGLFPYPKDLTDYIHRNGLTIGANLHDATGVGKWENAYNAMCAKLGYNPDSPPGPKGIPFSLTNKSYVYALEDIVLKDIEDTGMDFWWIDWQQGETAGGTGQDPRHKMNPTIWTDKMRVTDSIRRCKMGIECTNERGVVFARWGGLGNHRYQHGFSGDVAGLTWDNLAFQSYFSATASNVGWGWWSHDIVAPGMDNEMFTRWLQLGSFSGIMRSHDRGGSAGGCMTFPASDSCWHVRPYNAPLLFRDANREALTMRSKHLPYIYTQTKVGHETGLGLTRPMYYYWPEENSAYPSSMTDNLGKEPTTRQYMFGDSILAAPVTESSGCVSLLGKTEEPCALTQQNIWVPPGKWVEMHSGVEYTGPKLLSKSFNLDELPLYVKAGAIIPTIPVRAGDTIGLAARQYTELEFNVYPGADTGSYSVYEDDGATYDYLKGAFSFISAHYSRSGQQFSMSVNTTGTFTGQPASRAYTVKLVNTAPASQVFVTVAGKRTEVKFSRWGGQGTWSYEGGAATLVVHLAPSAITDVVQVDITTQDISGLMGLRGTINRAVASKRVLDESRSAPGDSQVDPKGAPLSSLAALGPTLSYLADNAAEFASKVSAVSGWLKTAKDELKAKVPSPSTCSSQYNTDASNPVRSTNYPNGASSSSEGDCCNKCTADSNCKVYVWDPADKMCYPLAAAGSVKGASSRSLGTPKSFSREGYAYDLLSGAGQ